MKIQNKILSGNLIIAAAIVIVGYFGMYSATRIEKEFIEFSNENVPLVEAVQNIRAAGLRIISSPSEYGFILAEGMQAGGNLPVPDGETQEEKDLHDAVLAYQEFLAAYNGIVAESFPGEKEHAAELDAAGTSLIDIARGIIALKKSGAAGREVLAKKEALEQAERNFLETVERILQDKNEEVVEIKQAINASLAETRKIVFVVSFIVLIITVLVSLLISRRIASPISDLQEVVRQATKNNLEVRASETPEDETGTLGRSFNKMIDDLKQSRDEILSARAQSEENRRQLQKALDRITLLIREVATTHDMTIRSKNPFMTRCYIEKNCGKKDCPCFDREAMRCWQTAGTYCPGLIEGLYAQKFDDCHECDVFKKATPGPSEMIGELFNDMMHILEAQHHELENAYETLGQIQGQLAQKEKMASLGTMAGGIAHEFNNILAAILGYTEMAMIDMPEQGKQRTHLEHVLRSGNRAKDLVQQIIAFSSKIWAELTPLKIHLIIEEALNLLEAATPPAVEIQRNICADCKAVLADQSMIYQVLRNLHANALQAMSGKGVLEISLQEITHLEKDATVLPALRPGEYVLLSVSDNGPGIDPAIRDRIFDPFFTTKEVGKGTGMGLSVVYGIVKKLGGLIIVDSKPGNGATFHVYLPAVQEESKS